MNKLIGVSFALVLILAALVTACSGAAATTTAAAVPITQPVTSTQATIAPVTSPLAPSKTVTVAPTTAVVTTTAAATTAPPPSKPATTTAAAGGPPAIPADHAGRTTCFMCHKGGLGGAPVLPTSPDHSSFTDAIAFCQGCHKGP